MGVNVERSNVHNGINSMSGEATAYMIGLLPRLALGKASTSLASPALLLVDPNECPGTGPQHNAHSVRMWEGKEVQFMSPQQSGAAATRSSLP
ncbi:hypothetical protein Lal_00004666 [Lupinus albus]|nr:hypothetical protein Lal_00004666 [Lupinus albus]